MITSSSCSGGGGEKEQEGIAVGAFGSLAFVVGESPRLPGNQRETCVNIAILHSRFCC